MTLENWAGIGLALAAAAVVMVIRRQRSATGQAFSAQIGDTVLFGRFQLQDGQVHVTCDQGAKSAPINGRDTVHVAEQLLVAIHAEAKKSD